MLATIIFNREQETTSAELLDNTHLTRRDAKEQIDSGKMKLDGLTIPQINAIFNNTPQLRQSFEKIMSVLSG